MPSAGGATAAGGRDWEGDRHRWHRSAGVQVCEHQLSRAQMEQDDFCLCDVSRARAVMFGMVQYFKAARHLMYTVTSSLLRFVAFPRQSRELLFSGVWELEPFLQTRSLKQTIHECLDPLLPLRHIANSASPGLCRSVELRHVLRARHASCEDSADRLQRLTAREALVLGWSCWGLGMFWLVGLGLCRSSSFGDAKRRRSNCGWRQGLGGRQTQMAQVSWCTGL